VKDRIIFHRVVTNLTLSRISIMVPRMIFFYNCWFNVFVYDVLKLNIHFI